MISVNEARNLLSEHSERGEKIKVNLEKSLDCILAEDIHSPIDVPSFDNSAMDGYAMQFKEGMQHWALKQTIQAGDTSAQELQKGEAARIFTGAKMPKGADTVIPQELIEKNEGGTGISYRQEKIRTGSNVRTRGSQCKEMALILEKGTEISPGVIGLLASVGLAEVKVFKAPSVTYVITGDELKEVGTKLQEGEIYNSNGPMLEALLNKTGIREITAYRAADDKEELQEIVNGSLAQSDVLILSGGISVGDYDFVKECLEKAGVQELFYKIKQRPGKPMFAGKRGKQWVFALPGNPASVLSCYNQYVKPCLRYILGHKEVFKADRELALAADHRKKPGFTFFVKALQREENVQILGAQQSFNLQAFSLANCLVELEEEKEIILAGTKVKVFDL